jgi:LacI family gluconate utilization system Gnt-I transcriptional repressor
MSQVFTQTDLAKLAGVSTMTVSRALRGHPDIQRKTRQRIERLAAEHGYRVNRGAQAMRAGRYGAIGLLLSQRNAASSLIPELMAGITRAAEAAGLHLVLGKLTDDRLTSEEQLPKLLRAWSVDGLIVHYTHHAPQAMARIIEQYQMKAVWTNTDRAIDCVTPDDVAAGRDAADRLWAMGHREAVYLDTALGQHPSLEARREGFVGRCRSIGLACRVVVSGGRDRRWFEGMIAGLGGATACVTYRADDAERVVHVAMSKGLDVPGDLSLLTFSAKSIDYAGLVAISHYAVPIEQVGARAVQRLVSMLAEDEGSGPTERLPLTWVEGQTLAAGPAAKAS